MILWMVADHLNIYLAPIMQIERLTGEGRDSVNEALEYKRISYFNLYPKKVHGSFHLP